MKNLYFIFSLFVFLIFPKAQILDKYPKDQDFYAGGRNAFLTDAHDFLTKNNIQKCPADQIYFARFIVMPDKTVKFVKDFDEESIKKNQCAYDLSLTILKNLKNWNPAMVDGKAVASEAEMIIYPNDLFENFYGRGDFRSNYKPAEYKKGNEEFRKDLRSNFKTLFYTYHINADFTLDFYVDEKGNIVNADVHPKIEDRNFANEFNRTLHWMDGKWKPATYKGIPVKHHFIVPMSFSTRFNARGEL